MNKLLAPVCLSVMTIICATDSIAADRSGGVSAGRDGVSVGGRGGSVSASREGASVSGRGGSVSASREGASVSGRGGSIAGNTAHGMDGPHISSGHVNAAGDRSYDDLESWINDLKSLWSGEPTREDLSKDRLTSTSSSRSSSVKQVSQSDATSSGGQPALATARNVHSTEQN
jgi:hypothetical protein